MNIDLTQFHFLRPYFLLLFVLLFWFAWRIYVYSKNSNVWSNVCDTALLSYLLVGTEKKKGWMHLFLLMFVGSLLIVAMAGPTWSKLPQAVYKKESARVFVLDLSRSMDATDLSPSRVSRAKLKLIDLLESSKEGQSALVVYAETPHVVSPLTDDSHTIISMIPSLSTDIMPTKGSRADRAIMKAAQLLTQAGSHDGDIVLLTDGVKLEKVGEVAEKIAAAGYRLNVIGIGTEQGAPIPVAGGGFLKDNNGNIVIPKLDKKQLKSLALSGGGIYSDITVDDSDIKRLQKMSLHENLQKNNPFAKEVDLWRDQGYWFLLAALPFAALSFRRGWLGMVLLMTLSFPQQEAYALSWDDLWLNKNQQAAKKLEAGDPKAAAELFEDPNWKGAAAYKSGEFVEAEEAFAKSDTAESFYNLGNALARQGKLQEAIDAYNNVLERNPNHKDAIFNKTLVQKILEKENSQQQQQGDNQQSDEQENSDNNNQQPNQESEQNKQNNKDQKPGDKESDQAKADENKQQKPADQQNQNKEQKDAKEQQADDSQQKQDDAEKQRAQQQESENNDAEQKERQQATEQWLRRVPDDPGGLLREKMRREHIRSRQRQRTTTENQW